MKFWKAILAGKLGMLCLRVGARGWAQWLIDVEERETDRLVQVALEKKEKSQVVDEKAGVCGFRLLCSNNHCQNREPCSVHGALKCWCDEKATHGCGEHSGSAGICGNPLCVDHQCRWAAHSREGALQYEQWTEKVNA